MHFLDELHASDRRGFGAQSKYFTLKISLPVLVLLLGGYFVWNAQGATPSSSDTLLAPFLYIIPSSDGAELMIGADGLDGSVIGVPYVNLSIGPGSHKRSYTMAYSDTLQSYVAITPGLTPYESFDASLTITTTHGLDSGEVFFNRAYVPQATYQTLYSVDGNLEMSVVNTDTLAFDTYVTIVPSFAPPGAIPAGDRLVGSIYSVRAADALLQTDRPMILRLYYSDLILGGADPETLVIFAWNASKKDWDDLGGYHSSENQYLSTATTRFTTYALIAKTAQQFVYLPFTLK